MLEEDENKSGTYVCVYPDEPSVRHIQYFCNEIGLENPTEAGKLHTTLLYSRKHVNHDVCRRIIKVPTQGIGEGLALFSQQDGKKCLVLKVYSLDLKKQHNQLIKRGGTHDYPTFEAHVTLARDLNSDFAIPKREVLIPIYYDRLAVKALDEDWK